MNLKIAGKQLSLFISAMCLLSRAANAQTGTMKMDLLPSYASNDTLCVYVTGQLTGSMSGYPSAASSFILHFLWECYRYLRNYPEG